MTKLNNLKSMKNIRFRAWNYIDKKMESVCGIVWRDGKIDDLNIGGLGRGVSYHDPIDGYELMQFMGIKDKNSVEIFEGDVVLVDGRKYKVEWRGAGDWFIDLVDDECFMFTPEVYELEVIGNIYENQELLK